VTRKRYFPRYHGGQEAEKRGGNSVLMKFEAQKLSPQIKAIDGHRIHGTGTIVGIFTYIYYRKKSTIHSF